MITGNFPIGCNDDPSTEVVSPKDDASKFFTSSPSQGKMFSSAAVKSAPELGSASIVCDLLTSVTVTLIVAALLV